MILEQAKLSVLAFLNSGKKPTNDPSTNEKIFILNLFSLIGAVVTLFAGLAALVNSDYSLASVLLFIMSIFFLAPVFHKYVKHYQLYATTVLYHIYFLMFYLLYTGGVHATGPLWIFLIAPVTFFVCGLKMGIINLLVFIITCLTILFLPRDIFAVTYYELAFKIRLIASFITVACLTGLYEYARESSYIKLTEVRNKFENLAKIDPLTKLSNRRDVTQFIQYEQRKLIRNKTQLSIILCDVDNFKIINDKYGHNIGDEVLIELAKVFKGCIRTQDTVSRWGGEEFLIVLPDTNIEQAAIAAKKIHTCVNAKIPFCASESFGITISMGISIISNNMDIDAAISMADKNLYKAKNAGKNRTFTDTTEIIP